MDLGRQVESALAGVRATYAPPADFDELTKFINSESICFPHINWDAISRRDILNAYSTQGEFLAAQGAEVAVEAAGAGGGDKSRLTDDMQIANTMRGLTGRMQLSAIKSAIKSASVKQIQALNAEGFFSDTTATLQKIPSKLGTSVVEYGPSILVAINKIVQDHLNKPSYGRRKPERAPCRREGGECSHWKRQEPGPHGRR